MSLPDALPMVPVLAHIAGMPVEETMASFAPVVAVAGGCCVATLRARLRWLRRMRAPHERRSTK
jgi:hypothetical protein